MTEVRCVSSRTHESESEVCLPGRYSSRTVWQLLRDVSAYSGAGWPRTIVPQDVSSRDRWHPISTPYPDFHRWNQNRDLYNRHLSERIPGHSDRALGKSPHRRARGSRKFYHESLEGLSRMSPLDLRSPCVLSAMVYANKSRWRVLLWRAPSAAVLRYRWRLYAKLHQ